MVQIGMVAPPPTSRMNRAPTAAGTDDHAERTACDRSSPAPCRRMMSCELINERMAPASQHRGEHMKTPARRAAPPRPARPRSDASGVAARRAEGSTRGTAAGLCEMNPRIGPACAAPAQMLDQEGAQRPASRCSWQSRRTASPPSWSPRRPAVQSEPRRRKQARRRGSRAMPAPVDRPAGEKTAKCCAVPITEAGRDQRTRRRQAQSGRHGGRCRGRRGETIPATRRPSASRP